MCDFCTAAMHSLLDLTGEKGDILEIIHPTDSDVAKIICKSEKTNNERMTFEGDNLHECLIGALEFCNIVLPDADMDFTKTVKIATTTESTSPHSDKSEIMH